MMTAAETRKLSMRPSPSNMVVSNEREREGEHKVYIHVPLSNVLIAYIICDGVEHQFNTRHFFGRKGLPTRTLLQRRKRKTCIRINYSIPKLCTTGAKERVLSERLFAASQRHRNEPVLRMFPPFRRTTAMCLRVPYR